MTRNRGSGPILLTEEQYIVRDFMLANLILHTVAAVFVVGLAVVGVLTQKR